MTRERGHFAGVAEWFSSALVKRRGEFDSRRQHQFLVTTKHHDGLHTNNICVSVPNIHEYATLETPMSTTNIAADGDTTAV